MSQGKVEQSSDGPCGADSPVVPCWASGKGWTILLWLEELAVQLLILFNNAWWRGKIKVSILIRITSGVQSTNWWVGYLKIIPTEREYNPFTPLYQSTFEAYRLHDSFFSGRTFLMMARLLTLALGISVIRYTAIIFHFFLLRYFSSDPGQITVSS